MTRTASLEHLWATYCAPGHAQWTWDVLRTLYGQPGRHYHTLRHVAQVLEVLIEMAEHVDIDEEAAALAAYWHDAVYVPGSDYNEVASAGILTSIAGSLKAERYHVDLADICIRRTKAHDPGLIGGPAIVRAERTLGAVLDADMSILGVESSAYALYVEMIRAEYSGFSPMQWGVGRSDFLRGQLDRKAIYVLPWSQERFEDQARKNMTRELEKLGG